MQTNLDSLFHKVFKIKYFANMSFLDAQLGKQPCFAWRSVMAAKGIMNQGVRWKIGNGKSVCSWDDKWLLTPSTFKVISPKMYMGNGELVSNLINHDLCSSKTQLIRDTLLPHEAYEILSIPPQLYFFPRFLGLDCNPKWLIFNA